MLGCNGFALKDTYMIDWWINLEPKGMQTFVTIGLISSAVLFIQMIAILVGGAFDVPDFDLDVGEGGATGMFSIRGVGAFFTGFGWTGAAVLAGGHSLTLAIISASVVGVSVLVCFVAMMRWLHGLRSEGTIDYKNAVGQVGSVYVPIPANRQGIGQVEVLVQGRMSTVRALTDNSQRLDNRTAVLVTGVIDERTLLVETFQNPSEEGQSEEESKHE